LAKKHLFGEHFSLPKKHFAPQMIAPQMIAPQMIDDLEQK